MCIAGDVNHEMNADRSCVQLIWPMHRSQRMLTDGRNIPCGIVEFVGWCIMGLVIIKVQDDGRDVGRPSVAMHHNCHVFCVKMSTRDVSAIG